MGKESACQRRRHNRPEFNPGSRTFPVEGNGNPGSPVFLPGKFHGPRSLMGYSPWGQKELDTTMHAPTQDFSNAVQII